MPTLHVPPAHASQKIGTPAPSGACRKQSVTHETVLMLGAASGIARALCHELAREGARLILAGRDSDVLQRMAGDLAIRYETEVQVEPFDALDFAEHEAFFARVLDRVDGELSGVVLAFGTLPDQAETEHSFAAAREAIDINFTAPVSLLSLAASYLETRRSGFIAAISSVAGDRGRQSNFTYGAAKAGLSTYLDGLRNRLHPAGVSVLSIKPGFVDTPMTAGLFKNPNSPLIASPQRVARDIARAIRRRSSRVLYTPWFWRPIMAIIRAIPEPVFKRLKL